MKSAHPASRGGTLGNVLISSIARFGDRPALSDGTKHWSYRQLGDAIGRLVAVYESLDLGKGSAVCILSSNRVECFAAICAALLVGARYTPLHPLAAEDELATTIEDAEIDLLIVDAERFAQRGLALRQRTPSLKHFAAFGKLDGALDILAEAARATPASLVDSADGESIALLAYTGGTTGRSKGVILAHRTVVAIAYAMCADWDWPSQLRFLAVTPISHAAGIILIPVLMQGGYIRLANGFSPAAFCEIVQNEHISATFLVPTLIYGLIENMESLRRAALSSLETIIYGAAPTSPSRLSEAIKVLGPIFTQMYGQMEAPLVITTLRKLDHSEPGRLGSCGRASLMLDVRLFDNDMREVGIGQPGEVCVRGPIVMNGYWKRSEATEQALRGGWLHTGDMAVKDEDGYFRIVDRIKDMIISGGFNIYPREVEDVLMSHPQVDNAAVIGVPDQRWGEAVRCFVVPKRGCTINVSELQAYVKDKRGAPWSPKWIDIVERIPVTSLGKIDRKLLREPFWKGQVRGVA